MTTLYLTPGDDFTYTAAVTDEAGDAYSLTNCQLRFTVKRRSADAEDAALAALYWVSGGESSGITVSSPSSGVAEIRLTPAQTADFSQASHVWDLQVRDSVPIVRTVDSGTIVVRPAVTQSTTAP